MWTQLSATEYGDWPSGLFDCCRGGIGLCAWSFFCPCFLLLSVAQLRSKVNIFFYWRDTFDELEEEGEEEEEEEEEDFFEETKEERDIEKREEYNDFEDDFGLHKEEEKERRLKTLMGIIEDTSEEPCQFTCQEEGYSPKDYLSFLFFLPFYWSFYFDHRQSARTNLGITSHSCCNCCPIWIEDCCLSFFCCFCSAIQVYLAYDSLPLPLPLTLPGGYGPKRAVYKNTNEQDTLFDP